MQKIWILYTGIGNGHKSVGESIKKELEKEAVQVEIFDSAKYANPFIFNLMIFLAVPIQKYLPKFYNYLYNLGNKERKNTDPDLFTKLAIKFYARKRFIKLVQKEKPDLIINTYFINSRQISYMKKHRLYDVPSISIITDHVCHNWFLNWQECVDYFIVPDENIKKEVVNKGINNKKVLDYGIPINSKFVSKAKTDHPKLRILFFGGGGLGFETSLPYLKALQDSDDLEIKFVSGKNQKLYKKAKDIATNNTEVIGYSNDVPKLLGWADLVVSKAGGITTTECINSNTPLISILSFGGHEKGNVDYTVSNNAGIWCNSPGDLENTIQQLEKNRVQIITMQENCNKLAKRDAVSYIVKLALNITNSLPASNTNAEIIEEKGNDKTKLNGEKHNWS